MRGKEERPFRCAATILSFDMTVNPCVCVCAIHIPVNNIHDDCELLGCVHRVHPSRGFVEQLSWVDSDNCGKFHPQKQMSMHIIVYWHDYCVYYLIEMRSRVMWCLIQNHMFIECGYPAGDPAIELRESSKVSAKLGFSCVICGYIVFVMPLKIPNNGSRQQAAYSSLNLKSSSPFKYYIKISQVRFTICLDKRISVLN